MSRSHYSGWTTHYSVKYKNKTIGACTDEHGNTVCPSCRTVEKLAYVDEHAQLGFDRWNKYFELNECAECGYKFCIVMIRKDVVYGV